MNKKTKRINKEIQNYEKEKVKLNDSGIYIHYDADKLTQLNALIFGSTDTPYHNVPFIFNIIFTDNYPFEPPKFKYVSYSKHRIHPNLYVDGKVCLSIINTWAGPVWSPILSIVSVLQTIQSILDINAITNEPGIQGGTDEAKIYDQLVLYESFNKIYPNMLETAPLYFKTIIRDHFMKTKNENIEYITKIFSPIDKKSLTTKYYSSWQQTVNLTDLISGIHHK